MRPLPLFRQILSFKSPYRLHKCNTVCSILNFQSLTVLQSLIRRKMSSKSALLILAEGAEEMEAVIAANVLRRGGIDVTIAGLESAAPVKCSRDVVIQPDSSLADSLNKTYDAVILPGGLKGSELLAASGDVKKCLKEQQESGRLIGAICAAPAVCLVAHEIGEGKDVTCYPALKDKFTSKYSYKEQEVVVDGQLITSQGPGTAFAFALALVEKLLGEDVARQTAKAMLL